MVNEPSCPNALVPGHVRVMGIDPGLNATGWGVIDVPVAAGDPMFIACGVLKSSPDLSLAYRLAKLSDGAKEEAIRWGATEAAIEFTYVNSNAISSLKLGHARGAVMAALANLGLNIAEYSPAEVKKMIVGSGRAEKRQVETMVRYILKGDIPKRLSSDSADALALALCRARMPIWQ